jgi:hypothetical protein
LCDRTARLQVVVAKYAKGMVTPDVLQLATALVPSALQEGDVLVKVRTGLQWLALMLMPCADLRVTHAESQPGCSGLVSAAVGLSVLQWACQCCSHQQDSAPCVCMCPPDALHTQQAPASCSGLRLSSA